MNIKIRSEVAGDYDAITSINEEAFKQKQEGNLIINLRKRSEFLPDLSLVAEINNKPVGHILFSPVSIISGDKSFGTLSLAPMAVLPEFQKMGVGGALIMHGLKKAQSLGYKSVVVLGHPDYYPRFGFRRASQWKIRATFDAPDEALMAIELEPGSLNFGGGIIEYPKEFSDV